MSKSRVLAVSQWAGKNVLVLSPTPTHPVDFGNRRRVYHVCSRLQDLGAAITFLHYPGESDWRDIVPVASQRAMMAQWENYYLVPVTRPLHMPPADGAYHQIDEWWDPSIGQMLEWLFKTNYFDAFIVNYTWLSKALEYAPEGVTKVLDTHDRFSGRREVLEANGIAPEFFYTTEDQERIALDRADVIWAIKSDEERFFQTITSHKVVTVLHAEPVSPRNSTTPSEVVRFGIAGARNNINARNFTMFLEEAHKYLRKTLLPCEIVIAGTCCDLLQNADLPFVRLLGRVESMDEFYDAVDIVLGPMSFSTGLKIKIGEALSHGKGIISHSHCFEGYVPTHPFQTLPSFWEMMRACAAVVHDPSLIQVLEDASTQSMHRANKLVAAAIESSLAADTKIEPAVVITIHARDVHTLSPLLDHALEVAEYIAHQSKVAFHIEGASTAIEAKAVRLLRRWGKISCSPATAVSLGGRLGAVLGTQAAPVQTMRDLMAAGHYGFWFACIPQGLPRRRQKQPFWAMLPLGILAYGAPDAEVVRFVHQIAESFEDVVVSDTEASPLLAAISDQPVQQCIIPFLWRGHAGESLGATTSQDRKFVTFLSERLDNWHLKLAIEISRINTDRLIEVVYDPRETDDAQLEIARSTHRQVVFTALDSYPGVTSKRRSGAYLTVQIGEGSAFSCLREMMHRGCVPVVRLFVPGFAGPHENDELRWREAGVLASTDLLADLLLDGELVEAMKQMRMDRFSYQNDAGWAYVWGMISDLLKKRLRVLELS
jgi:hypothetical protein